MFAGYKHVEAFGADAEYEDEVEVAYVTLDLGSNVHKELVPHASEYRLAGLDTETPMLQLGGTFFRGVHEDLIGTELLFTDGRDESNLSRKFVVPVATTERRIKFEQVEVREKEREGQGEPEGEVSRGAGESSGLGERGKEKGKGKGKGRARERSRKGKGKADEEETRKGMAPGEIVLDLDTPLGGIL